MSSSSFVGDKIVTPVSARSRGSLARILLPAALFAVALMGSLSAPARGQTLQTKIASDLQAVLSATTTPSLSWAKDVAGVRFVKVLIVSNADDPNLTSLRSAVMAAGGSIYFRYSSVLALAAMMPASKVASIAARSDVQSISPNRLMTRSARTLESVTGVGDVRATGGTTFAGNTGMTGRGIGIAVLDSGIAWQHASFMDDTGSTSRVREAYDFLKGGDATNVGVRDWTPGIDVSGALYPGSATMSTYLSVVQNGFGDHVDGYGHGSHV